MIYLLFYPPFPAYQVELIGCTQSISKAQVCN